MSSLSRHWKLLDSRSLSKPNYYFSQQFTLDDIQGSFAILSESLPLSSEIHSSASRSDVGARLAIEAAELTFNELLDKKLNFSEMFFSLFSKHWQAIVLLDAIENPLTDNAFFSEDALNNKRIRRTKKDILKHYDPSIALLYQFDQQLILLQRGYTQIALLNRRYHCQIKKTSQRSLSDFLVKFENETEPEFKQIDLESNPIEMVVLLSQQYTNLKTVTRLNTNIIKLYRQLDIEPTLNPIADNEHLIILKKEPHKMASISKGSEEKLELKTDLKAKKKSASMIFSLLALVFATLASYYFWQVQATEKKLTNAVMEQTKPDGNIFKENIEKYTMDQKKIQRELNQKIRSKKQQQKEKQDAIAKVKENELKRIKKAEEEAHITAKEKAKAELKRQQQQQIYAEVEAEKFRMLEEERQVSEREKQQLIAQEKKLKQKELARIKEREQKQREDSSLLSIEREIELIAWHNDRVKNEKATQPQALREQYAIKKQQKQRKREQEVKINARKQKEKQRLEALVRQRRAEFKRNKKQQQQVVQTPNTKIIIPENRLQQQRQTHQHIKKQVDEKRRNMLAELKKQQQKKVKAKDARQRMKQKTAVHQLVAYSKTFNRHTVQLKQKLKAINNLNQRSDAFSNPAIRRERALLQGKETIIRKRLDSLARLYSDKLKRLCSREKIYSVMATRSDSVERLARSMIAQQLRRCSQAPFISAKGVSRTLLHQYLK